MSAPLTRPSAEAAAWSARERRRVQRHLRRAERSARRAPVAALDPLRRLVRALLLDELAAYRARGRFPRNLDATGRTPVFVDALGTRCAVAHLLDASGESALVDAISARRNLATVDELADEARLAAWLHAAGLTLAEAAAIQPGYSYVPASCVCGREDFSAAPPYGTPATAVLDVQLLESRAASYDVATGVVVAIDGVTPSYAVGQTVRVLVPNVLGPLSQGSMVLVPVGGPTSGYRFDIPDGGHGATPIDGGADAATPAAPVDAGEPLLGGYAVQNGAVTCSGALAPLDRSQFIRAVEAPECTAVLGSIDARWTQRTSMGRDDGTTCACSIPMGAAGGPSTLGILLALLAARRRRRR